MVDEYAAQIVQMVFRLKLDGVSSQRIAEKLTEMGALPPLEYKRMLGMNFNSGFRSGSNPKWSVVAVNRILRNELYTGNMVQGKRKKISYKVKQSRAMNEADWIRVAGTHEAIIPTEEFDQVQRVMLMDTRTAPDAEKIYLFSGFHCLQDGRYAKDVVVLIHIKLHCQSLFSVRAVNKARAFSTAASVRRVPLSIRAISPTRSSSPNRNRWVRDTSPSLSL